MKTVMKGFGKMLIPVWAIGMILVVACLMVGHWVTLPQPEVGEQMDVTLVSAADSEQNSEFTAFHFLYGDCPCSRRVLKHVVSRDPVKDVVERIVLIGEDPEMEKRALSLGFEVDVVTAELLQERYGVESAPLMVITDQSGEIYFSGGYTSRKQGLDIQDVSVIEDVLEGEIVVGPPVFGCAVSQRLKDIVDPLGLKG